MSNTKSSFFSQSSHVGAYFWAGPGTIRLLQTKYHSPRIDADHFLSAYDLPYLTQLKHLFNITDAWVTYSWGFSDQTEREDHRFLQQKISNFRSLGIRTHAYVQGLNVVTREFSLENFYCVDHWGHRQPYSKGRSFICPNHPHTKNLLTQRIYKASKEDVDGVFVDNILFGFPPITVRKNRMPFFGCACNYCLVKFKQQFGYTLPKFLNKNQLEDYLVFREKSISKLVKLLSQIVHAEKKLFGVNLYDPIQRDSRVFFGFHLEKIEPYLDYLLIENHSLPRKKKNNTHLTTLITNTTKPVFVVSYQEGIGFEQQYTQDQIDSIFSEAKYLRYAPCLKVTEYTTNNNWHCLYLNALQKPDLNKKIFPHPQRKNTKRIEIAILHRIFWGIFQSISIPAISLSLNNRIFTGLTKQYQKELVRRI